MHDMYDENYLAHYGVIGMKWGVRRATKNISNATSQKAHDKAVASLNKHRSKGTAEIAKISKKNEELNIKRDKQIRTSDVKAAKYKEKAANAERKVYTGLRTKRRRQRLEFKAKQWNAKAESLATKSKTTENKIKSNEKTIEMMNREIDKIDKALIENGKRYLGR